jgi:hypothetical protein
MTHDVVVFDIADGDFRFYNSYEWNKAMERWRERLEDDIEDIASVDDEEVFDLIHGEECFFTEVPSDI